MDVVVRFHFLVWFDELQCDEGCCLILIKE